MRRPEAEVSDRLAMVDERLPTSSICYSRGGLAEPKGRENKWICRLGFNR